MYKINTQINPKIFRGYDLRGVAGEDLSDDVMYTLGRAYATWLFKRRIGEATVGHDNRLSSEAYSKAFITGLNDGGINTIDIGLSLSQISYFSAYEFKTKGSAMITASHNPKEFNGLKLGTGYSETMLSEEVQAFKDLTLSGKFVEPAVKGSNRSEDIFESYQHHLLKHFNLKNKWNKLVDCFR